MKKDVYRIILGIVPPIVFIALFLLSGGFARGATAWLGFALFILAYVVMYAVPLLLPESRSAHLFGVTTGIITKAFLALQFVISLLFIVFDGGYLIPMVVIEIIVWAIYAMLLFKKLSVDEVTSAKEKKQQQNASKIRNLATKAQMIAGRAPSNEIRRLVGKVYDELNSCPSNSNNEAVAIEESISHSLDALNQSVMLGDTENVKRQVNSLISLIKERKLISR